MGNGRFRYKDPTLRDFQQQVETVARETMKERLPYTEPVTMVMEFFNRDYRRRDLDNLSKSIQDAFNRVVYEDDYLVQASHAEKCVDKEEPRAVVFVLPYDRVRVASARDILLGRRD